MLSNYYNTVKKICLNAKLFMVGSFFMSFGLATFMLLFNLYLKQKGFDEGQIGTILMFGSLGAAIATIPVALLIERIHIKKILIVAIIISSIAYSLQVYNDKLIYIAFFACFAAMFGAAIKVATSPFFMRNSTTEERTHVFSINSAIMMLAFMSGYLFGGNLPDFFRETFADLTLIKAQEYSLYLAISISLIGLIPFVFIKQKDVKVERVHWLVKIKTYDWHIISKMMLPRILVGLGAGCIIPFMNLYFSETFNLQAQQIGRCYALMQITIFFAMLLAPIITRYTGAVNFIVITELLSIPFMLILALTANFKLAIIAFVARGALMNMGWPISNKFEMELVKPEDQAVTNAISQLSWMGSWAISAQFGGSLIKNYGFSVSFYVAIVFYFLSAACYFILFRSAKLHQSHQS